MEEEELQTQDDFVVHLEQPIKTADTIARLETLLNQEKEQRLEERFLWVCVVVIMFNSIVFLSVEGFWSFLPVFMLQLVLLFGAAKMWGVDWAVQVMGWLIHWISTRKLRP